MIKKAEYIDILSTFDKSAFGCRIISTAKAYGMNEPFAQFWLQEDKAAILKLDDTVILQAEEADYDELKDFICMTGVSRVICNMESAQKLGFEVAVRGQIMEYKNEVQLQTSSAFELNPSIREIYALLDECATDTFIPPEFEPFYMDMSHRIRHGTAASIGLRQGEKLISSALCSAYTQKSAVLSAVAVSPSYRLKGLGHKTISELISHLMQKNIYILRAQNENEEFYLSFGFFPAGEFAEMTI